MVENLVFGVNNLLRQIWQRRKDKTPTEVLHHLSVVYGPMYVHMDPGVET